MEHKFEEKQIVRLRKNVPWRKLKKGAVGKVVQREFYPREFYYVDFRIAPRKLVLATLTPDYMEAVPKKPKSSVGRKG